jgi:hypothetical protein
MLLVSLVVGAITLGFGLLITWPICILWGALASNSHNSKILARIAKPRDLGT